MDSAQIKYLNDLRAKRPGTVAYLRVWMIGATLTLPAVTVALLVMLALTIPAAVILGCCEVGVGQARKYVKRIKWGVKALRHFAGKSVA